MILFCVVINHRLVLAASEPCFTTDNVFLHKGETLKLKIKNSPKNTTKVIWSSDDTYIA